MPPLDLLSWKFWVEALGYWAHDSENLYRLALIVAGVIGIPLLYIRTRAVDRQAKTADSPRDHWTIIETLTACA